MYTYGVFYRHFWLFWYLWQVYRGNEAVAALALALSPRVARERWLQSALVRHFPEAVSVLRVKLFKFLLMCLFLDVMVDIRGKFLKFCCFLVVLLSVCGSVSFFFALLTIILLEFPSITEKLFPNSSISSYRLWMVRRNANLILFRHTPDWSWHDRILSFRSVWPFGHQLRLPVVVLAAAAAVAVVMHPRGKGSYGSNRSRLVRV